MPIDDARQVYLWQQRSAPVAAGQTYHCAGQRSPAARYANFSHAFNPNAN